MIFNYDFQEQVSLNYQFFLNDWSQICSLTSKAVPFVFSKKAQDQFYESVHLESYETYSVESFDCDFQDWYIDNESTLTKDMWSKRYQGLDTPWDLNGYHPCLDWTLPRLKLSRSKVLVPGCGAGHDAAKLSDLGHRVTGLDFSEDAISKARNLYKNVLYECADVFEYAEKNSETFDLVFEHTLFCALDTSMRPKLVQSWSKLLKEGGCLLGTFIICNKRKGPPFGVSEWELEQHLSPHFKIEYWGRVRGKESARKGRELFVYARKK